MRVLISLRATYHRSRACTLCIYAPCDLSSQLHERIMKARASGKERAKGTSAPGELVISSSLTNIYCRRVPSYFISDWDPIRGLSEVQLVLEGNSRSILEWLWFRMIRSEIVFSKNLKLYKVNITKQCYLLEFSRCSSFVTFNSWLLQFGMWNQTRI